MKDFLFNIIDNYFIKKEEKRMELRIITNMNKEYIEKDTSHLCDHPVDKGKRCGKNAISYYYLCSRNAVIGATGNTKVIKYCLNHRHDIHSWNIGWAIHEM